MSMNLLDRRHDANLFRYLDGGLSQIERGEVLADLSEREREEVLAIECALQALERLPRAAAPTTLVSSVMAALTPQKSPLRMRFKSWLERHALLGWEVGGMAVAASVLFMVLAPNLHAPTPSVSAGREPLLQVAATDAARAVRAKFSLYAPQAHEITLIGDFNGWGSEQPLQLRPQDKGIWTVEVPLNPGSYQYAFLIDGATMVTDPRAEQHVNDGFGRRNALITVAL